MIEGEISIDDPRAPDVRALLGRHLTFAREHTPPEDVHALEVDGLVDAAVTFYSFRRNGELLGVGALKRLDALHAELKSMHTAEAARRQGVGAAMLDHLVTVARERGFHRLSLETGTMDAFAPARSLYANRGFRPCDPYGDYVTSPNSSCMTMWLADDIEGIEQTGDMETMRLGKAGCEVSRLSLGSWRTYERISREQALAVMREARDAGINFLDDARYNDETGTAPIPTGYSEVVFGELFRAAGWPRDETIVSNKLWWEFWPEQTPAQELDASLGRMQLEHVDLIYTEQPPEGMELEDFVASVTALIDAGKARYWGVLNYPADLVRRIGEAAERGGHPPMVANQLPYSLVNRSFVEDGGTAEAMASAGASVVASFVLAGGVLSGKYDLDPAAGRAAGSLDDPRLAPAVVAARQLRQLADELGTDGSTLAIAFALLHDSVATVLFGATKPEQVRRNVAALDLLHGLDDAAVRRLRAVGAG